VSQSTRSVGERKRREAIYSVLVLGAVEALTVSGRRHFPQYGCRRRFERTKGGLSNALPYSL